MSDGGIIGYLLDNVVLVIITGVATSLIVWWLTKDKGNTPSSTTIQQKQTIIEVDKEPVTIGRDLIIRTSTNEKKNEPDKKDDHVKESRFDKIEDKIEKTENHLNEAIRELETAEREDEEDEVLESLEEDVQIATKKVVEAWEQAAYYYKENQIPREKFKALYKTRFKEFVRDPDIKTELRGKSNIKWLKKEFR